MISLFKKDGIVFQVSDLKDPRKLASSVTTSVRKSISKSITAAKSISKSNSQCSELGSVGSEGSVKSVEGYTICAAKPSAEE